MIPIAVIFAVLGLYTVYSAPRNFTHWLAGFAAWIFAAAMATSWEVNPGRAVLWACAAYVVTLTHIIINRRHNPASMSIRFMRKIVALTAGTVLGLLLIIVLTSIAADPYAPPAPRILLCVLVPAVMVALCVVCGLYLPRGVLLDALVFCFGIFWSIFYIISLPLTVLLVVSFPVVSAMRLIWEIRTAVRIRRAAVACTALAFVATALELAADRLWCAPYGKACAWIFPFERDINFVVSPGLVGAGVILTCVAIIWLVPPT